MPKSTNFGQRQRPWTRFGLMSPGPSNGRRLESLRLRSPLIDSRRGSGVSRQKSLMILLLLDRDQPEVGGELLQVERVACDDRITCRPRTNYYVSIRDVRRARLREQRAHGLRLRPVQRDHLGSIELD